MEHAEALEGWLLDLQARRRSPRTLKWYRETVGSFLRWCSSQKIDRADGLSAPLLRRYIVEQLDHLAPDTQHNRVAAIKAWSRWLEEQEVLPADPFRRVRRPAKDGSDRVRALSPDQVKDVCLLYDVKEPLDLRDLTMLMLTLDTGLRRGEVCGALLSDYDPQNGSLRVVGKGRKARWVPVGSEVKALLWRYLKRVRPKHDRGGPWLFLGRTGGQVNGNHLGKTFHERAGRAGVKARFHDLRHTAATYALRAGMDKARVSRMLGHSNDSITSIYEHLNFEDVQRSHAGANPLSMLK